MVDAAGKRRSGSRNAIATVYRHDGHRRRERCGDRHVETLGPQRLLRGFRKLRHQMSVVNDQARAPAVRRVGLAQLAGDVEPFLEAEPVTADPLRYEDAGEAGIEHILRRLG